MTITKKIKRSGFLLYNPNLGYLSYSKTSAHTGTRIKTEWLEAEDATIFNSLLDLDYNTRHSKDIQECSSVLVTISTEIEIHA